MRTIKFRGKRVDNGDWVYGSPAHGFANTEIEYIMPSCYFATRDFGEIDENGMPILENDIALGGFIPVHPETVGQFTGLLDKDGKEIYEGDVVKVNKYGKKNQVSVSIDEDGVFPFAYKYTEWDGYDLSHNSEIIGNIHDNPELL